MIWGGIFRSAIPKPNAGDEAFVDVKDGSPADIWLRSNGNVRRVTEHVNADISQPDKFKLRGKWPTDMYGANPPWEVEVNDDDESTGQMRRGQIVSGWAI